MTDLPDPQLPRMRRLATGLLVLMVILYAIARTFEASGGIWPWLRAFSEAGMVGALADWFAVTALFRHPLGLPIPHTAIVKKEKQRIGAAVGSFVRGSFLSPEEVKKQCLRWQPVTRLAERLARPEGSRRLLKWLADRVPELLGKSDRETVARLGGLSLKKGIASIPMTRLITIALKNFLKSSTRRSLIAPILGRLGDSVAKNRDWVMDEASKSTQPRKIKLVDSLSKAAASMVSGKAVERLASELQAASDDEDHPLYSKIEETLSETVRELEAGEDPRWETLKTRLLEDPDTLTTLEEMIRKVCDGLLEGFTNLEEEGSLEKWQEVLSNAAAKLVSDDEKLADLESRAADLVAQFFQRYGPNFQTIITRTVESWEADELISRLENQVGADLQFIRINGTLIGGLVGLLLHGVGILIW